MERIPKIHTIVSKDAEYAVDIAFIDSEACICSTLPEIIPGIGAAKRADPRRKIFCAVLELIFCGYFIADAKRKKAAMSIK